MAGASNVSFRALALIESGALVTGDVEALASRLGASPVVVAQTRRVLLAKQLVHETHLPTSEAALASGFGSVQRLNETLWQQFDRPPGALRRSRLAGRAPA